MSMAFKRSFISHFSIIEFLTKTVANVTSMKFIALASITFDSKALSQTIEKKNIWNAFYHRLLHHFYVFLTFN